MRVEWRQEAEADLDAAFSYLRVRNPRVAIKLVQDIKQASQSLARLPHRGRPGRATDTKELSVPPYILVYEIKVDADQISILRLWHAAQDR